MSGKELLKIEKFPTPWCPGCSLGIILQSTAQVMHELGLSQKNASVISGIGCTGRSAGFFNLDTAHGLHGRAIPLAEGLKRAKPELNVVVLSGDGDLTGIGGNHLIHAARRNIKLTVICAANETYGMTGGQKSPTTPIGRETLTSPYGNEDQPINMYGLIRSNKKYFYARTTVFHVEHMKKCLKEALEWDGFAFVEIRGACLENYGRRLGFKTGYDIMMNLKKDYTINTEGNELKENELGIVKA